MDGFGDGASDIYVDAYREYQAWYDKGHSLGKDRRAEYEKVFSSFWDRYKLQERRDAGECITPNGRTDCHLSYTDRAGKCAYCGKGHNDQMQY